MTDKRKDEMHKNNNSHIYYDDGNVVHLCDGAEVHKGILLLWTACKLKDVPADKGFTIPHSAFLPPNKSVMTCSHCQPATGE